MMPPESVKTKIRPMASAKNTRVILLPILLVGAAAGVAMIAAGLPTDAAAKSIKYRFSQSQTHLSLRVESDRAIQASQWSYAGPMDNHRDCGVSLDGLPDSIKGRADVVVSPNNSKIASVQIAIQPSDNNKYYCVAAAGFITRYLVDYNPPTIALEGVNHLAARDVSRGPYGPSGNVDSQSWQAAAFDVSQQGDSYGCNAENVELNFRTTPADIKYVGQYSHGNYNHVSYNVPSGNVHFIAEFFASLENALYAQAETDPALIPFDDSGQYTEVFTDNIHLCHRVSDPQGNTTYKLMRLDLGGPAIKLVLSGSTIQASSPAVDLDASTWQYYKVPHRLNKYICELLDHAPEPTGESATAQNVKNGEMYCFWALDEQGNRNTRLVQVDSGTLAILPPTPIYRPSELDSSQGAAEPEEATSPPAVNGESTEADRLTVGQQERLDEGNNSNQLTPGNIDLPPEVSLAPPESHPQVSEEIPEVQQEAEVALETTGQITSGASGQQVSQEGGGLPAFFKYLMFGLAALAAVAIMLMFVFLGVARRK